MLPTESAGWSLTDMMHGMLGAHDADGRPLGEVRAPSGAKVNVPMELVACPYDDARQGKTMNASALEQMVGHLKGVFREIQAFRGEQERAHREFTAPTWQGFLEGVIDQLTGPARFTLACSAGPIPVPLAVGHKLAAGYFGVLQQIALDEAAGRTRPVTLESFNAALDEQKALLGKAEVCAGPRKWIDACTRAFIEPLPVQEHKSDLREVRVRVKAARLVGEQLALGRSLRLFDEALEYQLLVRHRDELRSKSAFFGRRVEARQAELSAQPEPNSHACISSLPTSAAVAPLRSLMLQATHERAQATSALETLLVPDSAALRLDGPGAARIRAHILTYLQVVAKFFGQQTVLEHSLRAVLGLPQDAPVKLSSHQRPALHALVWYEALLGRKVIFETGERPEIYLKALNSPEQVRLTKVAEAVA